MLETNYLSYPSAVKEAMGQKLDYVNLELIDVPVVDGAEYAFTSWSGPDESATQWSAGKVKVVATVKAGYTKVEVLENTEASWIGKLFYVANTAEVGGDRIELRDEDKNPIGVWVAITEVPEEVVEEPVVEEPVEPIVEPEVEQ